MKLQMAGKVYKSSCSSHIVFSSSTPPQRLISDLYLRSIFEVSASVRDFFLNGAPSLSHLALLSSGI
jgi:hypothetical protein